MANKIKLANKSNVEIHGKRPGAEFFVDADAEGVPFERKWRNRLNDSPIDGGIKKVVPEEEIFIQPDETEEDGSTMTIEGVAPTEPSEVFNGEIEEEY